MSPGYQSRDGSLDNYLQFILLGSKCDDVQLVVDLLNHHNVDTTVNTLLGPEVEYPFPYRIPGTMFIPAYPMGEWTTELPLRTEDRSLRTHFINSTIINCPLFIHCFTHPAIAVENYLNNPPELTVTEIQWLTRHGGWACLDGVAKPIDKAVDYVITAHEAIMSFMRKAKFTSFLYIYDLHVEEFLMNLSGFIGPIATRTGETVPRRPIDASIIKGSRRLREHIRKYI